MSLTYFSLFPALTLSKYFFHLIAFRLVGLYSRGCPFVLDIPIILLPVILFLNCIWRDFLALCRVPMFKMKLVIWFLSYTPHLIVNFKTLLVRFELDPSGQWSVFCPVVYPCSITNTCCCLNPGRRGRMCDLMSCSGLLCQASPAPEYVVFIATSTLKDQLCKLKGSTKSEAK